jgi:hypothetical protein
MTHFDRRIGVWERDIHRKFEKRFLPRSVGVRRYPP